MVKKFKLDDLQVKSFITSKEEGLYFGGQTAHTICNYCPTNNSCGCSNNCNNTAVNCGSANPC